MPPQVVGSLEGTISYQHGNTVGRLDGASVRIGDHWADWVETGYFRFPYLPCGRDTLKVHHPTLGDIDTLIWHCESTKVEISYQVFALGGGIYRNLAPHEPLRSDTLAEYLRVRKPLSSNAIIDGGIYTFSTNNYADCNLPTHYLFPAGDHRIQINAADTYPLDTIFRISRDGTCDEDGYNFTLTPIPSSWDSQFVYPLEIGTTSTYRYSFSSSTIMASFWTTERHGDHLWTVMGMSVANQDSIYHCRATQHDTVRYRSGNPDTVFVDTTWVETATVDFDITLRPDSILSEWPSRFGSAGILHIIPRYYSGLSDSISIDGYSVSKAIYEIRAGLRSFNYSAGGHNVGRELLLLTNVSR